MENRKREFQIIYKCEIYTDGFNSIEEAEDSFDYYVDNGLDSKYLSIEVSLKRDHARREGRVDTRATLDEIAKEYVGKRLEGAEKALTDIKRYIYEAKL